jgi:hypothetical protein
MSIPLLRNTFCPGPRRARSRQPPPTHASALRTSAGDDVPKTPQNAAPARPVTARLTSTRLAVSDSLAAISQKLRPRRYP